VGLIRVMMRKNLLAEQKRKMVLLISISLGMMHKTSISSSTEILIRFRIWRMGKKENLLWYDFIKSLFLPRKRLQIEFTENYYQKSKKIFSRDLMIQLRKIEN